MEVPAGLPENLSYSAEILIAPTWECNLDCSYCFIGTNKICRKSREMSASMAREVVDALDEGLTHVEKISLHLYGGEPLLNIPAIEAMVCHAHKKKPGRFRFAITTNGTLVDNSIFDLLEKGRFQVVLSIDGPEHIHDQYRRSISGESTHARVMEFLKTLRSRTHCWVRGSSVVRSGWGLLEAVSYLSTLPLDAIKAQAVRVHQESPFALKQEEKQAYIEELEKIGKLIIAQIETGTVPKDDRFSSRVLQLLKGGKRESFCGAGHTTFGITPDGCVLSCILIDNRMNELGSISENPQLWITNGKKWKADHHARLQCQKCPALNMCGGGCYAINSICGEDECEIICKNCKVATFIYDHFKSNPEALLVLAGII